MGVGEASIPQLVPLGLGTWSSPRSQPFCHGRQSSTNSLGNAFSLSWSRTRLYAFPPFSQIADCLDKMAQSSRLLLLFVTKFDRAAPFWPLLLALRPKKTQEIRKENAILTIGETPRAHPPFDLAVFLFE